MQLVDAFKSVLGEFGFEGATIARVAEHAELTPGLVHHYFRDKNELIDELLARLTHQLRERLLVSRRDELIDALLDVGIGSDISAARAWVGIVAEAVRRPPLRLRLVSALRRMRRAFVRVGADDDEALALLAMSTGFLLLGALDPNLTGGRAASIARRLRLRKTQAR